MDLLEDLKMSLLNFNFVMIYIIDKMLVSPNLLIHKMLVSQKSPKLV